MPKACFLHDARCRSSGKRCMPEACFQHDDAIGLLRLTPRGRGPLAPLVHVGDMLSARREALQTMEVCGGFAPASGAKVLASMRHP
jgi:hypothetical protein